MGVAAASSASAQTGTIEGRLTGADGSGLAGIAVSVEGFAARALSDAQGLFALRVPYGTHRLLLEAAGHSETVAEVEVPAHGTARIERALDWDLTPQESRVAQSPSGRTERLLQAEMAVAVTPLDQVERAAPHGQLARLPEFGPGTELLESGLYDIMLNARGFGGITNRGLAVRLDGRDPSMLFLGGQEWASMTAPLDDYAQVELARGPASAVYGGNAARGVLWLVTEDPRAQTGGKVRLSGGERSSGGGDVAWSQGLGGEWYLKLAGSYRQAEDWSVARDQTIEYASPCVLPGQFGCLQLEAVPVDVEDREIAGGALRVDHHFERGGMLTVEGGASTFERPLLLTDLGRLQVADGDWQWGRFDYVVGVHWNLFGSYRNREANDQRVLATGESVVLDEESFTLQFETFWDLSDRFRVTAGGLHRDEEVATSEISDPNRSSPRSLLNPFSRQGSLVFLPVREEADGVYGSLDWRPASELSVVVGARYDDASIHEPRWSPRAALVYAFTPSQSLRVAYNEGFVVPSYAELFLQFDAARPVNLAVVEPKCALFGVPCGFDLDGPFSAEDAPRDNTPDTRVLALGNRALEVEETRTVDVGWRASAGRNLNLVLDYYRSEHQSSIVGLLPQLGTSLGRVNPAFGAYQVPVQIPEPDRSLILAQLQQLLGARFPLLSTNVDGTPVLALSSYANLGEVDSQGADLEVALRLARAWSFEVNYSWLDFEIASSPAGLESYLLPNAPEHRAGVSLGYTGERFGVSAHYRWLDDFLFVSGPFQGNVESFGTGDLYASVHLGPHFALGAAVTNVADEEHFELFGGDLLGRRALGSLTVTW